MLIPKCCKNCDYGLRTDCQVGAVENCTYKMIQDLGNCIKCRDHRIAVLEKALELCVNVLQREIDGADIETIESQAIYEIGKDYFISQAEKELEGKNEGLCD